MDKEVKKIIGLTAREIFLSLVDLPFGFYQNFEHPRHRSFRIDKLRFERKEERQKFLNNVGYLLRKRMIRKFIQGKKEYIELTKKGKKDAKIIIAKNFKIIKPKKWDGKWRIVIFDIADKNKIARDILRGMLKRMNFYMLQESVFIHPFDSYNEVKYIVNLYKLGGSVRYLISEIIEGEKDLINHFLKENILTKNDLRK